MTRRLRTAILAAMLVVTPLGALSLPALAVTRPDTPRLAPGAVSPLPSYVRRVEPAVVRLRVKARPDALSSQRLGARRAGSAVSCDARGCAMTSTYLLGAAESRQTQR